MAEPVWTDDQIVLVAIDFTQEDRERWELSAVQRVLTGGLSCARNFQLSREVWCPIREQVTDEAFNSL